MINTAKFQISKSLFIQTSCNNLITCGKCKLSSPPPPPHIFLWRRTISRTVWLKEALISPVKHNRSQFNTSFFRYVHQSKAKISESQSGRTGSIFVKFRHNENFHVQRLLKGLPNYEKLVFQTGSQDEQDLVNLWTESAREKQQIFPMLPEEKMSTWTTPVAEFVEAAIASYGEMFSIIHPRNKSVVDAILNDLKVLSDDELCQVLYYIRFFAPCSSAKDPSYSAIWRAIDKECLLRQPTWSLDFCFVVADLWYGLNLAKASEFHWLLLKKLFRRVDKLSKEHYIRFLFCLNLNRELPTEANAYDLEYQLSKVVDELLPEEIITVAVSFFKTQTLIRKQELLEKMLKKTMSSSKSLESVSVAAIAKLARYCSSIKTNKQVVCDFQKIFTPEISRLSLTACTHLALMGTNNLSYCQEFIKAVVARLEENIAHARLKELERFCLAATMFNAECDNLYQLIAQQLQMPERAEEIRQYGRCLPAILHYLSIKNVFIPELMSTCLSKAFRKTYYDNGKEIFQRELLCLDIAADIELPQYNGHRLEPKKINLIMKKNMLHLKPPTQIRVSLYQMFLRSAVDTLGMILESKLFYLCNILPQHHTMSIVLCQNQDGAFVEIPDYFSKIEEFNIKKIQSDPSLTYFALILLGRNMILNENQLTGQGNLQIRQVRTLGFKPVLVYFSEWEKLEYKEQQKAYLENLLANPN